MAIRSWLSMVSLCALVAAGCGSDAATDNGVATSPTDNAPATDNGVATSPTDNAPAAATTGTTTVTDPYDDPASDSTVMLAEHPDLGAYVVDGAGRTLYLFDQDDGTTTACTGSCADTWPPLAADGDLVAGSGIDADALSTADGIVPNQVTYHGHLLYLFAGDIVPGDTNGVGLPSWYAVDASGAAIE